MDPEVTAAVIEPGLAGAVVSATTVADALARAPERLPSDGVTWTDTASPGSPLPASERSKVSVVLAVFDVVRRIVVPTRHTYVSVTASPSRSLVVAVAVSGELLSGELLSR